MSSKDPTSWDLTLSTSSALVDQGDAKIVDPDGTRSDIGAFGGPFGDGW